MNLQAEARRFLLNAARQSIAHALNSGHYTSQTADSALLEKRGSFVTLKTGGHLRGCIGSLDAIRPLLHDVTHNALAAAFRDPRFPPLTHRELPALQIEISVLSAAEPLPAGSRADLLAALKPHRDGLIVQQGERRATFLPAVWQTLPEAGQFLEQLLHKAGWTPSYWSPELHFFRYHTESFAEGENLDSIME